MSSIDARVRYTRMIIEKSFLELLKTKHVSKVTVTELCQMAQINRATFYKHYLDVPNLLERMEEDLFDQIRKAFESKHLELEAFLLEMLRYTKREQERFFALGGENGDPNLMTKTFLVCYENAYPLVEQNMPGISASLRQMLFQFMSQGAGGILTWWIKSDMKEAPEEVVHLILKLCIAAADSLK